LRCLATYLDLARIPRHQHPILFDMVLFKFIVSSCSVWVPTYGYMQSLDGIYCRLGNRLHKHPVQTKRNKELVRDGIKEGLKELLVTYMRSGV
jgi:hypothetical protein